MSLFILYACFECLFGKGVSFIHVEISFLQLALYETSVFCSKLASVVLAISFMEFVKLHMLMKISGGFFLALKAMGCGFYCLWFWTAEGTEFGLMGLQTGLFSVYPFPIDDLNFSWIIR